MRAAIALLLLSVGAAVGVHMHVTGASNGRLFTTADVPPHEYAIVPGARISTDGQPRDQLADRLRTALQLWRAKKVQKLLLSGQGQGGVVRNEVTAMRKYLLQEQVPAEVLVEDPLGERTLDTMYRAVDVYHLHSAIVVTSPEMMARTLFLGVRHGLDVVGVPALHDPAYARPIVMANEFREVFARLRAWLDVFVWHTRGAGEAGH